MRKEDCFWKSLAFSNVTILSHTLKVNKQPKALDWGVFKCHASSQINTEGERSDYFCFGQRFSHFMLDMLFCLFKKGKKVGFLQWQRGNLTFALQPEDFPLISTKAQKQPFHLLLNPKWLQPNFGDYQCKSVRTVKAFFSSFTLRKLFELVNKLEEKADNFYCMMISLNTTLPVKIVTENSTHWGFSLQLLFKCLLFWNFLQEVSFSWTWLRSEWLQSCYRLGGACTSCSLHWLFLILKNVTFFISFYVLLFIFCFVLHIYF